MSTIRRTTWLITASVMVVSMLASSATARDDEADASQEALTFTIGSAVELALRVHPEVRSVREKSGEFGELVREARSEALPSLNAALGIRRTRDPGLLNSPFFSRLGDSDDGGGFPPEAFGAFYFDNYFWTFDVSQPIYTFGRVGNALKAAREERGGVNLDVQGVENRVSFETVQAAYAYLLAQQTLTVLQTEGTARERQLEQVETRFELQDATKLDVLRARVALANLRPDILDAENALQVARASVNNTLGRPINAPIEVLAELELPEPVPRVLRTEALLELAGQHRPELRRYGIDRRVLDARVGVTRSELRPQIRASAGFGVNTFQFGKVDDWTLRTWNAGVNFDWTIFDGMKTSSQIAVLRSQMTQSEHDETAFRNDLSVALKEANGTWIRALEALELTSLTVDEAREAERVAEESLQWGAATTLDVLQATLSVREAELNQTTAAHDALVSLAEMKYLVGFRADSPHSVIEEPASVATTRTAAEEGSNP